MGQKVAQTGDMSENGQKVQKKTYALGGHFGAISAPGGPKLANM